MTSLQRLLIAAAAGTTFLLSGCATTNGQQSSKAQQGAVMGAIAGAVLGNVAGHTGKSRTEATLAGAAIGGLAGYGVGRYMDEQEAALRQDLEGTGVDVSRQGDNIVLNMPGNITFDTGRADIKPQFHGVLDDVANTLNNYYETTVEVSGHTDSVGSAEFNQRLSEQRANSVRSYLIRKGVSAARITAIGFGESMPIASNADAYGRAQNRRVELTLVPMAR